MSDHHERIDIATQCSDCEGIPRVKQAGQVIERNGQKLQVMHNGVLVDTQSHYGAFNTQVIQRLKGHHEPQEERVFHEVLKHVPAGGSMIELGCFWAYYSMWFQQAVEDAKSVMVEPLDATLACGRGNFEINGLSGEFVQGCVGDRSLAQVDFESWDGSIHPIAQVCVDDLMDERQIDRLSILHADIQGAEFDMLQGASRALDTARVDYVFISIHSELLHRQCLGFLKQRGYRVIASHTMAESYSVDGLIAMASPNCPEISKVPISRKTPTVRERYRLVKGFVQHRLGRAA